MWTLFGDVHSIALSNDQLHCVECDEDNKCSTSLQYFTAKQIQCFISQAVVYTKTLHFSAMDVSVRATMKGAAKCDKHCELQNSVSRQGLEHMLCFWDIPKSMPASVFLSLFQ